MCYSIFNIYHIIYHTFTQPKGHTTKRGKEEEETAGKTNQRVLRPGVPFLQYTFRLLVGSKTVWCLFILSFHHICSFNGTNHDIYPSNYPSNFNNILTFIIHSTNSSNQSITNTKQPLQPTNLPPKGIRNTIERQFKINYINTSWYDNSWIHFLLPSNTDTITTITHLLLTIYILTIYIQTKLSSSPSSTTKIMSPFSRRFKKFNVILHIKSNSK